MSLIFQAALLQDYEVRVYNHLKSDLTHRDSKTAIFEAELAKERSKIGHLDVELIFKETKVSELISELSVKDKLIFEQADKIKNNSSEISEKVRAYHKCTKEYSLGVHTNDL